MSADTQVTPEVQPPIEATTEAGPLGNVPQPVDTTEPSETPEIPESSLPQRSETERLDPQPVKSELKSGTKIDVEPLKLRQFLALLRILTRGAGAALSMGGLSARDGEDFARQLMAMLLFAIPEAEDDTIDFVKSMVRPQALKKTDPNFDHLKQLIDEELDNPELEDVVTILELVVQNEADDLAALGKRLRSMFDVATKMGLTSKIS